MTATKEKILKHSKQIFEYYFGNFNEGQLYKSPLRVTDDVSSFNIFYSSRHDTYLYKDFGKSFGNAIDFVAELRRLSFYEAIEEIVRSLKLPYNTKKVKQDKYIEKDIKIVAEIKKENIIKNKLYPIIFERNNIPKYTYIDVEYWKSKYKLPSFMYLVKHEVYSTKEIYYGVSSTEKRLMWTYLSNNPMYTFREKFKDNYYFKVYRPYAKKEDKWRCDFPNTSKMMHGLNMLDLKAKEVIITKSTKDNIFMDVMKFNCISTQGEDIPLDEDIINKLKKIYKGKVYLLYDNDYSKKENTGHILSEKYANKHDIGQIIIPQSYEMTDVSDFVEKFELKTIKFLINTWKN